MDNREAAEFVENVVDAMIKTGSKLSTESGKLIPAGQTEWRVFQLTHSAVGLIADTVRTLIRYREELYDIPTGKEGKCPVGGDSCEYAGACASKNFCILKF